MVLEDSVAKIFRNYRYLEDIYWLPWQKREELARYSIGKILSGDEAEKGHRVIRALRRPALKYILPALDKESSAGVDIGSFGGLIDDMIDIAAKSKEDAIIAAKYSVAALHNPLLRDKVKPVILETAVHSSRFLIFALKDNLVAERAEELLRTMCADARYSFIATDELARASLPENHYQLLVQERAAKILDSPGNRNL
jgi:hypothetical protein